MVMKTENNHIFDDRIVRKVFSGLIAVGLAAFCFSLFGRQPERAWQVYLINLLVWSGMAHGALLFSAILHTTRARWGYNFSGLAESFSAFFPVSFILFLLLFAGKGAVFTWLHHDLHGKEAWLNLPFLFARDAAGLLILYGLGFAYLYHALWFKLEAVPPRGRLQAFLQRHWARTMTDRRRALQRTSIFSALYILAFTLVLSLLGYDLVMSMDPHWVSTLFGAYSFVKAIYIGLGGIIILAALIKLKPDRPIDLRSSDFHDIGKLFFAFCLVWADFFYVQFVVIWYGNIPEYTSYIIARTLQAPWQSLAWTVFAAGFIFPFVILLNRKIKTRPVAMLFICLVVLAAIWLEHLLLLGPAYHPQAASLPLSLTDGFITLGFLGMMIAAVSYFLNTFSEIFNAEERTAR